MDRRVLPLNALRVFDVVARRGSLTAGAEDLSITQSAATRHVRKLEDLVGQRLFKRTARGVELNAAGRALKPVVEHAFDAVAQALDGLSATQHLRIHFPPALLQKSAMEVLRDFRVHFPAISVELVSSNGTGEPADRADITVTFDRFDTAGSASELIRTIRFLPMCSRASAPEGSMPIQEFLTQRELLHVRVAGQAADFLWSEYGRVRGIGLRSTGGMTFETLGPAVDYARATRSVVLADPDLVVSDLEAGNLVAPYADAEADLGFGYYLTTDPETGAAIAATRMRRWLVDHLRCAGG